VRRRGKFLSLSERCFHALSNSCDKSGEWNGAEEIKVMPIEVEIMFQSTFGCRGQREGDLYVYRYIPIVYAFIGGLLPPHKSFSLSLSLSLCNSDKKTCLVRRGLLIKMNYFLAEEKMGNKRKWFFEAHGNR
jgi:hypothetical protein